MFASALLLLERGDGTHGFSPTRLPYFLRKEENVLPAAAPPNKGEDVNDKKLATTQHVLIRQENKPDEVTEKMTRTSLAEQHNGSRAQVSDEAIMNGRRRDDKGTETMEDASPEVVTSAPLSRNEKERSVVHEAYSDDVTFSSSNATRNETAGSQRNGMGTESKKDATGFTAFFAVDATPTVDTMDSDKVNGLVTARVHDKVDGSTHTENTPGERDEESTSKDMGDETLDRKLGVFDGDDDIVLQAPHDKSFRVNGANDNDAERVRQFSDYKATSMEQLRQNVDEAKKKSMEAKERVAAMQRRVDKLQEELAFAENEFKLYLSIKEEENESIVSRVNELEDLSQMRDARKQQAEEKLHAAAKECQDKLLKEIEAGKFALREAKEELNEEKEASAQIQSRLDQAKKQVEAERAAFEREEAELLEQIHAQKTKVADAEIRLQKKADLFEEERTNLGEMLQDRITGLAETNARLQLEKSLFSMNQMEVQRNIDTISSKLKKMEEELQSNKKRSMQETKELEKSAEVLRQRLGEATEKLESQRRMSQQAKDDLVMKCVFEKVKAKNLAAELKSQQELFRKEINALKATSGENHAKLEEAVALLNSSRAHFADEENTLKDQLADYERIGKLKAKQMSKRYHDVREEMTGLWQDERRKARQEQEELHEKYSKQLSNLQGAIPRLERDVMEARQLTDDLRVRVDETRLEKAAIIEEGRVAEMRYIQKKRERNIAISALEAEINDLQDDIAERDDKLATYKSSLRVLLGLAMKLAGERIRATSKRLLSRVRGPKKARNRESRGKNGLKMTRIQIDSGDEE